MSSNATQVFKDLKERTILVSREFDAPIEMVWKAFTEKEILDRWWGPSPWRAETKFQDFREGGYWLYAMIGPDNEKHWGRMNYIKINKHKNFELEDVFCDENGVLNEALPVSRGVNEFTELNGSTRVEFKMTYSSDEQIKMLVEMGFEQGITACFEQLNQLLINKQI